MKNTSPDLTHLVDRGIRVNAIAPGPVWTPLNPADRPAEKVKELGADTPVKRAAPPEEIAPAFVVMAAPCRSSYITATAADRPAKERELSKFGQIAANSQIQTRSFGMAECPLSSYGPPMTEKASAAGWVVQVSTQRPTEGAPKFEFFNVAISAADKAIEATKKKSGAADDALLATVRQLSSPELASINLRAGDVKPA